MDSTEYRHKRVATAAFWHTFHHDGQISPGWRVGAWGARPPPFTLFTITYKVAVYAPAVRADTRTFTLFNFYPPVQQPYAMHSRLYPPVRDYEFGYCTYS